MYTVRALARLGSPAGSPFQQSFQRPRIPYEAPNQRSYYEFPWQTYRGTGAWHEKGGYVYPYSDWRTTKLWGEFGNPNYGFGPYSGSGWMTG